MDNIIKTDIDNVIFLLEDLMLTTLRSQIYENNALNEDAKVEAITIIENHTFSEEEVLWFISTELKQFIESEDILSILESEALSIQDDVVDFIEEGYKEWSAKRKQNKEAKSKEKEQKKKDAEKLEPGQTKYKLNLRKGEITTTSPTSKQIHDTAKAAKETVEKTGQVVDKVSKRLDTAERKAKTGVAVLGVLALLAAAGYVYKRAIDKCKGLSGSALIKCRYNAAKLAKEEAEKRKSQCNKTNNPEKCIKQSNSKIEKYKKQMEINKT